MSTDLANLRAALEQEDRDLETLFELMQGQLNTLNVTTALAELKSSHSASMAWLSQQEQAEAAAAEPTMTEPIEAPAAA